MLIVILLLIISSGFAYYVLIKPLQYWGKRGVKQKNVFSCFLNSWFSIFKPDSVVNYVKDIYDEFPNTRYSGLYQFGIPVLTLRDPELIKQITIKELDHFLDRRTYIPEDLDPLFGKSLFSLKGEKWRNMRYTLSPTFTSSKMKEMFVLIKECSQHFVDHFSKMDQDVLPVQFKDISTRFCTDVIGTVAFGIGVDSLENPDNEFYTMCNTSTDLTKFSKMLKFIGNLMAPKLYRLLKIQLSDEHERTFFTTLINDAIKAREERGIIRHDMIHLLLQTRNEHGIKHDDETSTAEEGFATVKDDKTGKGSHLTNLSNEDITAQAFVFIFAGYESVSTLICFMAHELAVNQDVQEKLRAEIYDTNRKCNGELTYDVIIRMKYMDMVISEVLRKWPSQAGSERICTKPYILEASTPDEPTLHIETGTIIVIPTFGMHRDPEYFPDPERFDPERFSDENKHKIVPYSYTPFGNGPRGCIGSRLALLETKILFFYLLSKFEIVPVKETCIPIKLTKSMALLSVEGGCWLGLKRIVT